MSNPVPLPFKQDGEVQNHLTPQPPKESWLNGRRKRPPQLPRNQNNSATGQDDIHTLTELSSLPSSPHPMYSQGALPSLSSKENSNGGDVVSFFYSYLSPDEIPECTRKDSENRVENLNGFSLDQADPRLPRRITKPSKLLMNIRADESYHGKMKEERLEKLRATPINDSPAQLSGATHQLPERPQDAKYTVVLDIDNTLIHAVREKAEGYNFEIDVPYENRIYHYYVFVRPYVKELLDYLRANKEFEVIVFTAAKEAYGREIVRHLDPEGTLHHHFLSVTHIRQSGEVKAKDLQRLGRPVHTICIVEDTPESYKYQRRSSFPLSRWRYTMEGDIELKDLLGVLEKIKQSGNLISELDDFKASKLSNHSFKLVLGAEEV